MPFYWNYDGGDLKYERRTLRNKEGNFFDPIIIIKQTGANKNARIDVTTEFCRQDVITMHLARVLCTCLGKSWCLIELRVIRGEVGHSRSYIWTITLYIKKDRKIIKLILIFSWSGLWLKERASEEGVWKLRWIFSTIIPLEMLSIGYK